MRKRDLTNLVEELTNQVNQLRDEAQLTANSHKRVVDENAKLWDENHALHSEIADLVAFLDRVSTVTTEYKGRGNQDPDWDAWERNTADEERNWAPVYQEAKAADPELEALLAQEEELHRRLTIAGPRVYELARELGKTNKEVLDACKTLGINVKSHSSRVNNDEVEVLRTYLLPV